MAAYSLRNGCRHTGLGLGLALLIAGRCQAAEMSVPTTPPPTTISWSASDRVLVLAPHPDDETIACGGVLQQARAMKLPTRVVFFTYGDNNEWSFTVYRKHIVLAPSAFRTMGMLRHDEAVAATATLGVPADDLTFLGYPDFRTLRIWTDHWRDQPPLESMFTRTTTVPYTNAYRTGAPYRGESVLADLTAIIREFRPTRVFVSHPADYNPDHRALYLFTRVALWNLQAELRPALYPYLVHFPKWPPPHAEDCTLLLTPPPTLALAIAWESLPLTAVQYSVKSQAIRKHRSQFAYSSHYLERFMCANELFGDFPPLALSLRGGALQALARNKNDPGLASEPGDLTEEERAHFVGVEWRHVRVDAQSLTVAISLSRPLGDAVTASLNICGYRPDVPFAQMPKIHIAVGTLDTRVFDNGQSLPHDGDTKVQKSPHELEVVIPWKTVNSPQKVMISARTYLGETPLDWAAWRIIDITP